MSPRASSPLPARPGEPDPPMVELAVHHVRMPVGEHLPAAVVLCPCTRPGDSILVLSVGPAEAEALLAVLRGALPSERGISWLDRCVQALTRAAVLQGRRLLLRLVPGPAGRPLMRLEAIDDLSRVETPISVTEGLLASLQWRIPLLGDARLLRPGDAESVTVAQPAGEASRVQTTSDPGASSLRQPRGAPNARAKRPRMVGDGRSSAWHGASHGLANA